MAFVLVIALCLFAFFVFRPAHSIAYWILTKQGKLNQVQVNPDKVDKLAIVLCIPVYLFLWWLLEVTGLRAIIADEF